MAAACGCRRTINVVTRSRHNHKQGHTTGATPSLAKNPAPGVGKGSSPASYFTGLPTRATTMLKHTVSTSPTCPDACFHSLTPAPPPPTQFGLPKPSSLAPSSSPPFFNRL